MRSTPIIAGGANASGAAKRRLEKFLARLIRHQPYFNEERLS